MTNLEFFLSFHKGEIIPGRFNRLRIYSVVQLLCNTRLVLIGTKPNYVIFSIVHKITTHNYHHNAPHISAKDLLSK